jgi:hypothetical protein
MTVASSEAAGAGTDVKIGRMRNGVVEVAVVEWGEALEVVPNTVVL